MKKNKKQQKKLPGLRTLNAVLTEASTSKKFVVGYTEELTRLKLASSIKQLRTRLGMTQEELSKQAGMPQSVIARLESGKHATSLSTLTRVATALNQEIALTPVQRIGTISINADTPPTTISSPYYHVSSDAANINKNYEDQ